MSRYLIPVVAVLLFIPFLIIGLTKDPSELPSPFIGKPAPEFDLPALLHDAERVNNARFGGEMVLVNIWATWCVGCRQEHAFLNQLAQQNFIPIFGINWRDNRREAISWLQDLGNPYVASGFDGDGRVGIDWGAYGAPETFLIGADGTVLYKHLGPLDQRLWQERFMPIIRNQEDPS